MTNAQCLAIVTAILMTRTSDSTEETKVDLVTEADIILNEAESLSFHR